MLEDYETGMRRKTSRHTIGRIRWILLASLVANFFLIYKYWSQSTEIVILQTKNLNLNADMQTEQKQMEHYKKQTLMTEERRSNCEKRFSEIDDKVSECQNRHKECSDTLETTSTKLMELNQNVESLTHEKEHLNGELENKIAELDSVKEQVQKLQRDIETYERSKPNHIVMKQQQGNNDATERVQNEALLPQTSQGIKSINPAQQDDKILDDSHVAQNIPDKSAQETPTIIECDFSDESSEKGKCNYMMQPADPHWEFGRPTFLKEHSVECLYIDDSISDPGLKMNVIFQAISTEKCLEMTINATIVGGGQLSVEDNDKSYDVIMTNAHSDPPIWELQKFYFEAAPSHNFGISGMVNKYGGVAVTGVTISEGECGLDAKEDVKIDEDQEMVKELEK